MTTFTPKAGELFFYSHPDLKSGSGKGTHLCLCLAATSEGLLVLPFSSLALSTKAKSKKSSLEFEFTGLPEHFWLSSKFAYSASDKLGWCYFDEHPELKKIASKSVYWCSDSDYSDALDALEFDLYKLDLKGYFLTKVKKALAIYEAFLKS